jgi:sialate O-acetylesterase
MRILFDHADGLNAKAGPPAQLWIAGADRRFYPATGALDGNALIVTSMKVPVPVAVRYAWTDNPQGCNLYNSSGLPAPPFRTDTWSLDADRIR